MLQYLYTSETPQHSQEEIGEQIGWSGTEIGRLADLAEDNRLLTVNDDTKPRIYTVTKAGREYFEEVDPYSESWEKSETELDLRANLHNVTAKIPLSYPENLPDGWKQSMLKVSPVTGTEYWRGNDSVKVEKERFIIRFTSENAFIRIEDPIISSDLSESQFEAISKVLDAKKWCEEQTPVNFDDRVRLKIDFSTQHIAIEGDPLHYFADELSEVDLNDVELRNDEGELILWCDCSDGKRHLEMGQGGSEIAEDGIEAILSVYRSIIENRDNWREVLPLIEEGIIEDLHNHIRQHAKRLRSLEKRVTELEENNTTAKQDDSLTSPKTRPNRRSNYRGIHLAIKPLNLILMQMEVISIDEHSFDKMLRQTVREEVKKQLGMLDTSKRRTENELKDLIQEELEKRPKTATELRNALDANRSTVLNQLQKLEDVGVVEEVEIDGSKHWRQK